MIALSFTFDVVTPESAEHGDTSDAGFCDGAGQPIAYVKEAGRYLDAASYDNPERPAWRKPGDLREAIRSARNLGCSETNGPWQSGADISKRVPMAQLTAYSTGETTDYRTGESTTYAFHIAGVTLSTARRIARLLAR